MKKTKTSGKVYLVGAGPGELGLLTLKARDLLSQAQLVFYDHLVNPQVLNFCPGAQLHYIGKVGHGDSCSQKEIEQKLLQAAKQYSTVVRLKGGDPFIFGRGGEEAEFLRCAGVPFEIIPGVSSATAVPSYAGIPLTHRDLSSSVTFVTGHEGLHKGEGTSLHLNWSALAGEKTLVFLMGVKTLSKNFEKLIEYGKDPQTPAAIIEWGTYPNQRTVVGDLQTLPGLAQEFQIGPPSIVVVGEVVKFREKLEWFEKKPLFGKKILITRTREQASQLRQAFEGLGAWVLEFPTLQIRPPSDFAPLDQALEALESYDWVLFTSVNGVDSFFQRLRELKKDIRSLGKARLLAVGPATAERLTALGLQVERQPEEFTTDALGACLKTGEIRGKKILLPRAEEAREEIVQDLKGRGALVDVVPVYRMVAPHYSEEEIQRIFQKNRPDLLTFASSSTVKNLFQLLERTPFLKETLKIPSMVIGPITREMAEKLGFQVVGMPREYTIPGLVQAVLDYFGK